MLVIFFEKPGTVKDAVIQKFGIVFFSSVMEYGTVAEVITFPTVASTASSLSSFKCNKVIYAGGIIDSFTFFAVSMDALSRHLLTRSNSIFLTKKDAPSLGAP